MGHEIDLLKNYPKANRDLSQRAAEKTEVVKLKVSDHPELIWLFVGSQNALTVHS